MVGEQKLTNLQLELLKLFALNLPESQLNEIRELLADYFAKKADEEVIDTNFC